MTADPKIATEEFRDAVRALPDDLKTTLLRSVQHNRDRLTNLDLIADEWEACVDLLTMLRDAGCRP